MDINVVIQTMIKLFMILCLGYVLNKTGVFDAHVNKKVSSLIVNVTSPLLVIASVCSIKTDSRTTVLYLIGISFLMYIAFALLGELLMRLLPFPKEDHAVYKCMTVFANTAFMGYPVVQSVLGSEAIFYTSMLHMAFNFFIYSYGVLMITSSAEEGKFSFDLKALLTPGFILSILSILIYLLQIPVPAIGVSVCETVGAITSPMSMMMIGSSLAMYPLKECFGDPRSYLFAIIRLLLIPSMTAGVCALLHVDAYFSAIAIITNGMPVASMTLMLATQYNKSQSIVTKNIVVTTLLSVVSIPLIVKLFIH